MFPTRRRYYKAPWDVVRYCDTLSGNSLLEYLNKPNDNDIGNDSQRTQDLTLHSTHCIVWRKHKMCFDFLFTLSWFCELKSLCQVFGDLVFSEHSRVSTPSIWYFMGVCLNYMLNIYKITHFQCLHIYTQYIPRNMHTLLIYDVVRYLSIYLRSYIIQVPQWKISYLEMYRYTDGLVQHCSNSIAFAIELL